MTARAQLRSPGGVFLRLAVLVALIGALVPGMAVAAGGAVAPAAVHDVYGTVTDADTGDPIEGAVLTGYYMDWAPWQGGPRNLGTVVSGPTGYFGLTLDPGDVNAEEKFWIEAYADGYAGTRVSFARPDTTPVMVDVELGSGELALYGTVTDAITGDPVEGATVSAQWTIGEEPDAQWFGDSRFTDAAGEYAIYGLPVGVEFSVTFGADDYEWVWDAAHRTWDGEDPILLDWELMPLLPYFEVDAAAGQILGWRWDPDAELDVKIARGGVTQLATTADANDTGFFMLWPDSFDIEPGDVVTVTDQDAGVEKELIVTALAIDRIDAWQDTIVGSADAAAELVVRAWKDEGDRTRKILVGAEGVWIANWAERGLNEWGELDATYDLREGDEGIVTERDADGDATRVSWTAAEADPVIPIAGEDRFETAVKASQAAFPTGADTVVIATGRNWPDALGGSALAGAVNGPILLVEPGALPAVVAGEIERLGATSAIIVGGPVAVSAGVETALVALLGGQDDVDRVWGDDRYQTADAVALRVIELSDGDFDGTAFVATGGNFPDALAAAPLAARQGWPIFLANPVTGLSAQSKAAMADVTRALILGGELVVTPATEAYLVGVLGSSGVKRLGGVDRYETAVKVATFAVAEAGHMWDGVGITTGFVFPDALAGGVLQGKRGSVMLLTRPTSLDPYTRAALVANKGAIATVVYFGGPVAIDQVVRDAVADALK